MLVAPGHRAAVTDTWSQTRCDLRLELSSAQNYKWDEDAWSSAGLNSAGAVRQQMSEGFLEGVEGAGADVAIDDADGAEQQSPEAAVRQCARASAAIAGVA